MSKLTLDNLIKIRELTKDINADPDITRLMICGGTGCHATGSIKVKQTLFEEIEKKELSDKVKIVETGCNGFCALGPLLVVQPGGIFYVKLKSEDIPELIEEQIINNRPVKRLLFKDPASKKRIARQDDISFFAHQMPRALRNKGKIDPEKIEDLITDKTKAIVVVHFGGRACDMDKIMAIAKKHNLFVVEDSAHAAGGKYKEKMLGSIGDFGSFSFQAVKNMATGDGGMLVTNNKEWYDRLQKLRWVGITKDTFSRDKGHYSWFYDVVELGHKFHMNDITAAIGLAQLEKLDWMNSQREKWSNYYDENLKGVGDIQIPVKKDYMTPAYHNYVIKTAKRDELQEYLKDKGISTGVHYYPNHLYKMYQPYYQELPVTEKVWKKLLTLPLFPALKQEEIDFVISSIKDFFNEK